MVSNNTYLLGVRQPEKAICEENFGRRPVRRRKQRQEREMDALSARRIANVELLRKRAQSADGVRALRPLLRRSMVFF